MIFKTGNEENDLFIEKAIVDDSYFLGHYHNNSLEFLSFTLEELQRLKDLIEQVLEAESQESMVAYCEGCQSMTHTINGICGKCKADKSGTN